MTGVSSRLSYAPSAHMWCQWGLRRRTTTTRILTPFVHPYAPGVLWLRIFLIRIYQLRPLEPTPGVELTPNNCSDSWKSWKWDSRSRVGIRNTSNSTLSLEWQPRRKIWQRFYESIKFQTVFEGRRGKPSVEISKLLIRNNFFAMRKNRRSLFVAPIPARTQRRWGLVKQLFDCDTLTRLIWGNFTIGRLFKSVLQDPHRARRKLWLHLSSTRSHDPASRVHAT